MDAQLVEATIKTYLDWRRVSREGPRSGTRHGATSLRGNNAAECREPDQPDRSTKLTVIFLSLLPAGACAFRGVAVVAAMMPHDSRRML